MQRYKFLLSILVMLLGACEDDDGLLDGDEDSDAAEFRTAPLSHPSGICRIESEIGYSHKRVLYFHKSNPGLEYYRDYCDPWVGTAACCEERNWMGLTYDQCAHLRNDPDCPRPAAGKEPKAPTMQK